VRLTKIEREREVNLKSLDSELNVETMRSANAVKLAVTRVEAAEAEARAIAARAGEAQAEEAVRTARETAAAERDKALALIRAAEQAEVDDTRVKSEADTLVSMAEAEAKAILEKAGAQKAQLLAEAEGRAAVIAAENSQSPDLIAMKLDEARLQGAAGRGRAAGEARREDRDDPHQRHLRHGDAWAGGEGGGEKSTVNQVVDSVLSMALQLPAVQKLGEEVGMNIGDGVRGIAAPLAERGLNGRGRKPGAETPATKD
jgi:flotillin